MKLVYSYYVLDIVHKGHLLMMKNSKAIAGEDGKLIVGILTDEAVMEKKPKPILSFEDRVNLASAIKYGCVSFDLEVWLGSQFERLKLEPILVGKGQCV